MMVNVRTRVPTVKIAFSSSRNVALTERKTVQYKTVSIKLHHWTLSELKAHVFTLSDVLACLSTHRADQK